MKTKVEVRVWYRDLKNTEVSATYVVREDDLNKYLEEWTKFGCKINRGTHTSFIPSHRILEFEIRELS